MSGSKFRFEKEECCIFDDTPEFEKYKQDSIIHSDENPIRTERNRNNCKDMGRVHESKNFNTLALSNANPLYCKTIMNGMSTEQL